MPTERRVARRAAAIAAVLALAAVAAGLWLARSPGAPERVVLVVIDTLRRDFVSAYGGKRVTPHFDALARRGQLFQNVLASFHQTTMSMAALFTGRTPSVDRGALMPSLPWNSTTWCGMARFRDGPGADELCIPDALPTLAEELRGAGYWTIGIASNELMFEPSGFGRGFDDWLEIGRGGLGPLRLPLPGTWTTRTGRHVHAAVERALARRPSDRFFLYVHVMDAHDYPWRKAKTRRAAYREAVADADAVLGRLLATLERLELLDGAVVIVTSDHGERLGESHALEGLPGHRGNPSFHEVLEVPLVVAPPVAKDSARLTRSQDLFHLVLSIANVTPTRGDELAPDELLLGERHYRTYLNGRFKSVVRRRDGELHLFDLERDPRERRNVAESHPDVTRRHLERMEELSRGLGAEPTGVEELSQRDRARLRALGYLAE